MVTIGHKSNEIIAVDAVNIEGQKFQPIKYSAQLRYFVGTVTVPAGGLATGVNIEVLRLPTACHINPFHSWIAWGNMGASTTLSIGWDDYVSLTGTPVATSANGILNAISVASESNRNLCRTSTQAGISLSGPVSIIAVVGGATLTAGTQFTVSLAITQQ